MVNFFTLRFKFAPLRWRLGSIYDITCALSPTHKTMLTCQEAFSFYIDDGGTTSRQLHKSFKRKLLYIESKRNKNMDK